MKDLWGDEPFRDGQQELVNGKWKEAETYTPVPENTIRAARAIQQEQAEDESPDFDIEQLIEETANEEDEDDFEEVLSDARLRLEQGKLYEMVMNHDLFKDVEGDPRAAKSVQKEIRKFAKERLEIMLGIRKETTVVEKLEIDFPFNAAEVTALKDIAFKLTNGASQDSDNYVPEVKKVTQELNNVPKKKTLNTIGNPSRQSKPQPIAKKAEPIKRQGKPKPQYAPELEMDYEPLQKPIHEMTPQELAERDQQAAERQKGRMVITSKEKRAPWPSFEEQVSIAQSQVTRAAGGVSGISALNGSLSRLVMANIKK